MALPPPVVEEAGEEVRVEGEVQAPLVAKVLDLTQPLQLINTIMAIITQNLKTHPALQPSTIMMPLQLSQPHLLAQDGEQIPMLQLLNLLQLGALGRRPWQRSSNPSRPPPPQLLLLPLST
jgi:hypothetical protein